MFWSVVILMAIIVAVEERHNGRRLYFGDIAVEKRRSRFVRSLSSEGYLVTGAYPDETYLVGRWYGFEDARIRVRGKDEDGDLTEVVVSADAPSGEKEIRRAYEAVSAALRREYGDGEDVGKEGVCGLRTHEWSSQKWIVRIGVVKRNNKVMIAGRYIVRNMNAA